LAFMLADGGDGGDWRWCWDCWVFGHRASSAAGSAGHSRIARVEWDEG
jgi:hypothetical protein